MPNTLSDGGLLVWLTKTIALAALFFSLFVISGQLATYVFKWTGCIWASSAVFGLSMLGSSTVLAVWGMWDILNQLLN
jgi:hypothetical protein